MSEFDLIQRYFTRPAPNAALGVGDDAALLTIPDGMELAISTDMLVSGTHFFPDADPLLLGHKTLAVNLSDMAAMGATPCWATLALSMPGVDEFWLQQFSTGFFKLAEQYGVELIGGDTTKGPLTLCVTIMGTVPRGMALKRDGAMAGDDIWVSGTLGCAALALAQMQGRASLAEGAFAACAGRLHQPTPRVALGMALRGMAHSAIDISDGLLADLGHILENSKVGAQIVLDKLPISASMQAFADPVTQPQQHLALSRRCILAGGDDYELCFTAPAKLHDAIQALSKPMNLPLTRIGTVVAGSGCTVFLTDGIPVSMEEMGMKETGYDPFR
jgi:thiamine-monophosphate kinase